MPKPYLKDVYPSHEATNFPYVKHWKLRVRGIPCVALDGADVNTGAVFFIKCKDDQEVQKIMDEIDQRLKEFYVQSDV